MTLVSNWLPFEEPNGGPNFYQFRPGANCDINVDSNGDAKADTTYRWVFTNVDNRNGNTFLYNNGVVNNLDDPTLLFKQTYTLAAIKGGQSTVLVQNGVAAPSNVGPASMPNYGALRQQAITPVAGGGHTYAGQADDSFFLDLRIFDLLNGDPTGNPVIGVWSTTAQQTMQLSPGKASPTGDSVQVSRLGNPLVNEVISPANLKDAFNGSTPDSKNQALVNRVTDPEVPKLIQTLYQVPAPATPRNDLVEIFLTGIGKNAPTLDNSTPPIQADLNAHVLNKDVNASAFVPSEQLRLNMSVPVSASPNRLGVLAGDNQGFPNGRRLTDDVVDIELQALEGAARTGTLVPALAAGDQVNANDSAFGGSFPYVALPHNVAVNRAGQMPNGGVQTGAGGTSGHRGYWYAVVAGLGAVLLLLGGGLTVGRRRGWFPGGGNSH